MQLIIDTQKDSKEELKKAAAFLNSLADGNAHNADLFGSSSSPAESNVTDAFSSMFGGSETPVLAESAAEKKPDESNQEDEDKIQIIEY